MRTSRGELRRPIWRDPMKMLFLGMTIVDVACGDGPTPPEFTGQVTAISTPAREIPGFFWAFSWPGNAYTTPVLTQPYDASQCPENPNATCLNHSVFRQQWNDLLDWKAVADWARTHRGHMYILGDGLHSENGMAGLYMNDPALLAKDYCTFVRNVRDADPASQFTPGLIEPWGSDQWLNALAQALLAQSQSGNCSTNPVAEWEFNHYGKWSAGIEGLKQYVNRKAAWAMSHPAPIGAPLFFSAWTMGWAGDDVPNDDPAYLARLREFKAFLFAHPSVVGARALSFEPWTPTNPDPHPLADAAGTLNATGRVYAEVTARIAGPTAIRPGSKCSWIAERTGGSAPYAYKWLVNGAEVATQAAIAVANAESEFSLELLVTDATGGYSKPGIEVAVRADAPPCS